MKTIFICHGNPIGAISGIDSLLNPIFNKEKDIWLGTGNDLQPPFYSAIMSDKVLELASSNFQQDYLWKLFLSQPLSEFKPEEWEAYKEYNKSFAELTLSHYNAEDIIFVHDYRFMLFPKYIKQQIPSAKVVYFHHTPFPNEAKLKQCPIYQELINGVSFSDRIGVHTESDKKNFLEMSAASCLVAPASINYNWWANKTIEQNKKDKTTILAVERVDPIKGTAERIKAFDLFLNQHPEFIDKVVLVQNLSLSRMDSIEYQELYASLVKQIDSVNSKYQKPQIHLLVQNLNHEELIVLYKSADIAWITPLIDGMNLVCKEFIATKGADGCKLILSSTAGASKELKDAIIVNPLNIQEQADAVYKALISAPVTTLLNKVKQYTVFDWYKKLLNGI